jgi:hypothetical protein
MAMILISIRDAMNPATLLAIFPDGFHAFHYLTGESRNTAGLLK